MYGLRFTISPLINGREQMHTKKHATATLPYSTMHCVFYWNEPIGAQAIPERETRHVALDHHKCIDSRCCACDDRTFTGRNFSGTSRSASARPPVQQPVRAAPNNHSTTKTFNLIPVRVGRFLGEGDGE